MQWPKDNEAALIAFYGNPGPEVERQLVKVVPPFQMFYEKKPLKYLLFHRKAAAALSAALNEIWEAAGRSQAKLDHDGVSSTAGTYCCRKIRGSTRWSNHAFGGAIDLDAEHNGFFAGKGTLPPYVIAAFDRVGFRWGGRYTGRTDPMHFEACDDGRPHPVALLDMPLPDGAFEDWDGDAHVASKGCALVDDAAFDEHEDEEAERTAPSAPSAGGFFGRLRNWAVAGASSLGFGGLGFLTDWQIAAVFFLFIVLMLSGGISFAIWFFGKEPLRQWVVRHVA